nr:hypothetical protein Iba_scaffold29668CG0010 [Ipomoea batatas]GME08765.1 hypothetical protein Iba_scaffold8000.4CG0420 [Ipomoea batatas]
MNRTGHVLEQDSPYLKVRNQEDHDVVRSAEANTYSVHSNTRDKYIQEQRKVPSDSSELTTETLRRVLEKRSKESSERSLLEAPLTLRPRRSCAATGKLFPPPIIESLKLRFISYQSLAVITPAL